MADLDREMVERVRRWCAEAGRTAGPAEIRAALGGLGWDALLAARALLADPPPARPLGPYGLADLARGVPPDQAAQRERDGRYPRPPAGDASALAAAPAPAPSPAAAKPARRRPRRATVVVRKPAPRPAPAAPPSLPLLDELLVPEGRAVLERLVRRHGASRPRLVADLTGGWRRADGLPVDEADLERLLEHHAQARAFRRREHDGLLHALKAAGGVRSRAAAALGYAPEALPGALERAGAAAEAERLREAKRREVLSRAATVTERARLVLADPERLRDLGLLAEFEADLRARLPELLKALSGSGEPLPLALANSLAVPTSAVHDLAARLGLALGRGGFSGRTTVRPSVGGRPPRQPPRGRSAGAGGRSAGSARPGGPPRAGGPVRSGPRPASRQPSRGGPRNQGATPRPPGRGPPRGGPPRGGPARRPGTGGRGPTRGGAGR